MIDGNLAMNSHFENMSEKDSNDVYDNYIAQEKRKEAIAFAEWINGRMYECFLHTDENIKFWHDVNGNGKSTTDELYDLYLQSLTQHT